MTTPQKFFDEQYRKINAAEDNVLDHGFYRYLLPFARTRDRAVSDLLGGRDFGDVLDLGCGTAKPAQEKMGHFKSYTGLDVSGHQLEHVPEALRRDARVKLLQGDLNAALPFADGSFDLVLCISVIQYIFDPIQFVRETRRVLRAGGVFLVNTVNLAFFWRRLQLLFGRLPTYCSAPGWQSGIVHDFTFRTLYKLLEDSGFCIEQVGYSGVLADLRGLWPNFLASDMTFLARKTV